MSRGLKHLLGSRLDELLSLVESIFLSTFPYPGSFKELTVISREQRVATISPERLEVTC